MEYIADLHIHSHFSRATAKNLNIENIYIAAQLKGIKVVGSGDFTHPGWFSEIKKKLIPAEEGLFRLKDHIAKTCDKEVPLICRAGVRFLLTAEISNIYKKRDKIRKNHNIVFLPTIKDVSLFNSKLDRIGNIKSDGRPILGLDARNLLEELLHVSEKGILIPAHIWTPWFSVLGSKSGFDSIEECFEDLSSYIFAIETGLSSDPEMNWRVSQLDNLTLISNSDAHSPQNIGREANLFNTPLSYHDLTEAIKTGDKKKFLGTFELFPEEGKYHLDGHRKCNVRLWPTQSIKEKRVCPKCGKPLTLGVLYRIEELSDRLEVYNRKNRHPFYSTIALVKILSEILMVGPKSKKVKQNYDMLLKELGPEFHILHKKKIKDIEKIGIPLLSEAIFRMRNKKLNILPGYDGEFGKIKIFDENEIKTKKNHNAL